MEFHALLLIEMKELIQHIDEVDQDSVARVAARLFSGPPTVTALGPIGRIEPYDRLVADLTR